MPPRRCACRAIQPSIGSPARCRGHATAQLSDENKTWGAAPGRGPREEMRLWHASAPSTHSVHRAFEG
eukprot:316112-Alexandrium_andersonii.AAC.1